MQLEAAEKRREETREAAAARSFADAVLAVLPALMNDQVRGGGDGVSPAPPSLFAQRPQSRCQHSQNTCN